MLKIRLLATGRKKAPRYRIVVANERSKRDGAPLEILGFWNKSKKDFKIDKDRLKHWTERGAQISPSVAELIK